MTINERNEALRHLDKMTQLLEVGELECVRYHKGENVCVCVCVERERDREREHQSASNVCVCCVWWRALERALP